MSSIEKLFNLYIDSLWKEGERFTKIKLLSFALGAMKTVRRIVMSFAFVFMATIVFTAACFSALIFNLAPPPYIDTFEFYVFNAVILFVGLLALSLLVWVFSEKRWLAIFNVQNQILSIQASQKKRGKTESEETSEEQRLIRIIEKILDEKLDTYLREQMKAKEKPTSSGPKAAATADESEFKQKHGHG